MGLPTRLLSALALVAALSARADVRGVLHEPREGQVLRGGMVATVSWSSPQLPRFVEEWEAFLSVDGGRYYGYRITPHLDIDLRQFTFEVPNIETADARILIRAGNEHREIEVETSQAFVIERDFARALAAVPLEVVEDERGEPARIGDRGVIEWIEGRRDGSHLETRSALRSLQRLCASATLVALAESVEEPGVESVSAPKQEASRLPLASALHDAVRAAQHRTGREVLLTGHRLNI